MQSHGLLLCLTLFFVGDVFAFTTPRPAIGRIESANIENARYFVLNMAPKDPSRSGTKTERMDRLAEMEKLGAKDEDNSVFIKAAGAFAAFIVVAIAAAAASGLLTQY